MEALPIGSVSFFINTSRSEYYLNDQVANAIAKSIIDYLQTQFREKYPEIIITGYQFRRGCLIVKVFLAIAKQTAKAKESVKEFLNIKQGVLDICYALSGWFVKTQTITTSNPDTPAETTASLVNTVTPDVNRDNERSTNEIHRHTTHHLIAVEREDLATGS